MTHSAALSALQHPLDAPHSSAPVVLNASSSPMLEIPGGNFLLTADFHRSGGDLVLSGHDGHVVVVRGYFDSHTPPSLLSGTGGIINPDLAAHLAGPVAPGQWAADGAPQSQLEAIGEVQKLSGAVKVRHADGREEMLQQGATIFKGDVLETAGDGSVGIVFADRSTFSLGKNGRMVMDDLVYDPQSHTGHSSMSVVQGTFTFVSGQIAKSGPDAMQVKTPVMTIGIRGTTVGGYAAAEGAQNTVALLNDDDGGVGQIVVATQNGQPMVLTQANMALQLSSAFQAPPAPVVLPPQALQQLIPDLSAVQSSRPPQPTSDPHINTNPSGSANPGAPQGQQGNNQGNSGASAQGEPAQAEGGQGGGTSGASTPSTTAVANASGGTISLSGPSVLEQAALQTQVAVTTALNNIVQTQSSLNTISTVIAQSSSSGSSSSSSSASVTTSSTVLTTTVLDHTTSLSTLPLTNGPTGSVFVGTSGADIFVGSSGANTFIGHGGSDTYTLGASTNILVLDSNAHNEVVIDSTTAGAVNIVNASLLHGGFAGAQVNASGDLVVSYDPAAGGGTTTFKNYYGSDSNVLTVVSGSETHTFLKDTTGHETIEIIDYEHSSSYNLSVIVGTTGNDIIVGASGDLVIYGNGGNDEFILGGLGGFVIGGETGENTVYFNHVPTAEVTAGLTIDITGQNPSFVLLEGEQLYLDSAISGNITTYLSNIENVWGSNYGDTFFGGVIDSGDSSFLQRFYAGHGDNLIVDISSIYSYFQQSGLAKVLVVYEASTTGITADLSELGFGSQVYEYQLHNSTTASLTLSGYVYHDDGATDVLYGVSGVEGSAYADTLIGSSYGGRFVSSLGDDIYYGNGSNGLNSGAFCGAVEVCYDDSLSPVIVNMAIDDLAVTHILSSGETVTYHVGLDNVLHDMTGSGAYIDQLNCIEEVRLSESGGWLYGDGSVVLDLSLGSSLTTTVDLAAGHAYGWACGVTDVFTNVGGVVDYGSNIDYIVTSTALESDAVWGNSINSTLDLHALGSSVYLADVVNDSGVHSGTAFLYNGSGYTELDYGGITSLVLAANTGGAALAINNGTLDLSSYAAATVDLTSGSLLSSSLTGVLIGDMPSASSGASLTVIEASDGLTVLKGTIDELGGIDAVNPSDSASSLALEVAAASISMTDVGILGYAQSLRMEASSVTVNLDQEWHQINGHTRLMVLFEAASSSNDLLSVDQAFTDDIGLSAFSISHSTLVGGVGDDFFSITRGSNVTIDGGVGHDVLALGSMGDTSSFTAALADTGYPPGTVVGSQGEYLAVFNVEVLIGSIGNDYLTAAPSAGSTLIGGGGTDILVGGNGNDLLSLGGSAGGTLMGGLGDDTLLGSSGLDTLYGGDGNDLLVGGSGVSTLSGGDGADTLMAGSGTAVLIASGFGSTLIGGSGHDTEISGLGGGNTIIGGSDSTLDYHMSSMAMYVDFTTGKASDQSYDWTDTLIDVHHVVGSSYNDVFQVTATSEALGHTVSDWHISTSAYYSDSQTVTSVGGNTLVFSMHDNFSYGESLNSYWYYTTTAQSSGTESINWNFTGFNGWYEAHAEAYFYDQTTGDSVQWDGTTSVSLNVNAGDIVGFKICAGNYDYEAILTDSLTVTFSSVTDSIDGGAGSDTLTVTGSSVNDLQFSSVINVETLTLSDAVSVTLGSHLDGSGISTVNLYGDGNFDLLNAAGTTSDLSFVVSDNEAKTDTIIGGAGTADLQISGDGANLTDGSMNHVSKIDVLTLSGNSDQLTLTVSNLADMVKTTNAVTNDNESLIVVGNSSSSVNLTGGNWAQGASVTETVHGQTSSYTVYHHIDSNSGQADGHVYVDNNIVSAGGVHTS